jgi:ABC-type antimicrobial peptide transport system permease subunit
MIAQQTGVALPVTLGASEWRFAGIWALASLVLAAIPAASLYRIEVAEALRG